MIYDYLIIGSGLSGLTAANLLTNNSNLHIAILDKSRGVGGRLATRRTLETKFDHGAQFYRLNSDSKIFHTEWAKANISKFWFSKENDEFWCAQEGMTGLAKQLSKKLTIFLEKEINNIQYENNTWILSNSSGEIWVTKNLIISAPLPQTLKLIDTIPQKNLINQLAYEQLSHIKYTKALVALLTLEEELIINNEGYREFENDSIFSIADQKGKGLSQIFALTVTMGQHFSEENFDKIDSDNLELILKEVTLKYPSLKIKASELKKWRYCQPLNTYSNLYEVMAPQLYLIGDSFGGSSLLGAIRSGQALAHFLKGNK